MPALDVTKITKEFQEFELDPGKLDTAKVHGQLLIIQQTLDLSGTAHCRAANALLASLFQVIGYKTARCHYWERILTEQLKYIRIVEKRKAITSNPNYNGTATQTAQMEELAELSEEVTTINDRLSTASAARYFWEHIESMLHDVAKRIDSASASLGVEAKMRGTGG